MLNFIARRANLSHRKTVSRPGWSRLLNYIFTQSLKHDWSDPTESSAFNCRYFDAAKDLGRDSRDDAYVASSGHCNLSYR
jgi:hypothetical protein